MSFAWSEASSFTKWSLRQKVIVTSMARIKNINEQNTVNASLSLLAPSSSTTTDSPPKIAVSIRYCEERTISLPKVMPIARGVYITCRTITTVPWNDTKNVQINVQIIANWRPTELFPSADEAAMQPVINAARDRSCDAINSQCWRVDKENHGSV